MPLADAKTNVAILMAYIHTYIVTDRLYWMSDIRKR